MNKEQIYVISAKEKELNWQYKEYNFSLPESTEQLLEIDKEMNISVIHARIDLIIEKKVIPIYVKNRNYKILILLKKSEDNCFLLDYFCGVQKTLPAQDDLEILKKWCEIKNIQFSNGVRL